MRWNEAKAALRPLVKKVLREYAEELEEPDVVEFVLVSDIAMWIWSNFGLEPDSEAAGDAAATEGVENG